VLNRANGWLRLFKKPELDNRSRPVWFSERGHQFDQPDLPWEP